MTLLRILTALLLLSSGVAWGQPVPASGVPRNNPPTARSLLNVDPYISTMDSAIAGTQVYGDATTFDQPVCASNGNSAFCRTSANSSNLSGSTVNIDVLPPYIAASGVIVSGAGITGSTTVTAFTGSPGGPGTVTLAAAPSTTGAVNFTPPATVATFQGGSTTTQTITATAGGITITFAANYCLSSMTGMPVAISGLGPNGSTLYTKVTVCSGTQGGSGTTTMGVEDPIGTTVTAQSETVAIGANFQQTCGAGGYNQTGVTGCIGSGTLIESWAGGGGGGPSATPVTITAVYASNIIQVSAAGTQVLPGNVSHVVVGHDDSTAVNNICNYGKANHYRYLSVPNVQYAPSLSRVCYDFLIRGSGRLIVSDDLRFASGSGGGTAPFPDPIVIPWTAMGPTPPRREVTARTDLRAFRSTLHPAIASTYDSLSGFIPNLLNGQGSYPYAEQQSLWSANQGMQITIHSPGVSGSTLPGVMDSSSPVTATNLPCITSTSLSWFANMSNNCQDQLFFIGGATNDDAAMDPRYMLDVTMKLQGVGGLFASPADTIWYTNHPRTIINNGPANSAPTEDGSLSGAGILCSGARVMGLKCLDGHAEGMKHIWGWDPYALRLARANDVPYNDRNLTLPFNYGRIVYGFGVTIGQKGKIGATFASQLTGGAGTDPRGPFVRIRLGAPIGADNPNLFLFWDGTSSTWRIECDVNSQLPGMGCDDPATGMPPVWPAALLGNVTVSNTGAGGVAQVIMSGGQALQNCTVGKAVTIPGAGPSVTPPFTVAYTAPLITTVQSCDSSTQMTLAVAANTTYSNVLGFALWGNPIITSTAQSDPGNGGNGTDEAFHVEVLADNLWVYVGQPNHTLYQGKVWRGRARFQPAIVTGGTTTISSEVYGDSTASGTTWQIASRVPNLNDFTPSDVVGPSTSAPVNNTPFLGLEGGDGYAHNTGRYGLEVIQPLFNAQDWAIGNGNVSVSVTGSYTVPNCLVGQVNVNSTSAATITLPAYCATPIKVVDSGGHAATATITAALPSGGTLSGSTTITSAFGKRSVDYTGATSAVAQ